jgi:lipopolysaccharide/colanic/teichoic acid biosynthesis glycosyltransferase
MSARVRLPGVLWDTAWLLSAGLLAYLVRWIQAPADAVSTISTVYLATSSAVGLLIWQLLGIGRRSYRLPTQQDAHRLGIVAIAAPVLGMMASFLFDLGASLPRSIPVLHAALLLGGLIGARLAARAWWQQRTVTNEGTSAAPSVGLTFLLADIAGVAAFLKAVSVLRLGALRNIVIFAADRRFVGLTIRGVPIGYHLDDFEQIYRDMGMAKAAQVPLVLSMPPGSMTPALRHLIAEWPGQVRTFRPVDGLVAEQIDETGNKPVPEIALPGSVQAYLPLKRFIDIAAALVLLAITAIPFAFAALAVRCVMGSPVLFWQWRPGHFGHAFRLIKLRSMRNPVDASGNVLTDEQRLGRLGNFLRRTRLDEVPQFWSILTGEMSLIGPRPLIHQQQSAASRRLLMKPGISGWAQVNGGQLLSTDDKEALDCWYVDHASLALDLKIIVLTIGAVLFGDRVPEGMQAKPSPLAGAELSGGDGDQAHPGDDGKMAEGRAPSADVLS